ncbi:helix-turn-helix transcriptional regulator [Agrobacterium tumefaciens]|nr:helix-turn-helix transcriptional regulator [Agrobacterium tumefaciens]NTE21935.1 helix-turn-helix transcriptional regulator [Agrobacterium tumefaciens]
MKKQVGSVIKELRKKKQLKQQYVAFKLGITTEAYANIENGRADINTNKLRMISLILNIKASLIIAFAEDHLSNISDIINI